MGDKATKRSVATGPVVSEDGRRWAAGDLDSKTYFERVWRSAREAARREVQEQLESDESALNQPTANS